MSSEKVDSCITSAPLSSILSFILVICGAGISMVTILESLRRIDRIFVDTFYPVKNIFFLQISFFTLTAFTIIISFVLLCFGICNNTKSFEKASNRRKPIKDGLCKYRLLYVFSYFLLFIWIVTILIMAIPTIVWAMLSSVCKHEKDFWKGLSLNKDETKFTYTLNLTNYGLFSEDYDKSVSKNYINTPLEFYKFCTYVSSIGPMVLSALVSSILVFFGLNTFMACVHSKGVKSQYYPEICHYQKILDKECNQNSMNLVPPPSNMCMNHTQDMTSMNMNNFMDSQNPYGQFNPQKFQSNTLSYSMSNAMSSNINHTTGYGQLNNLGGRNSNTLGYPSTSNFSDAQYLPHGQNINASYASQNQPLLYGTHYRAPSQL